MARQYSKEFKEDAVKYYNDHPELGVVACAKNLGISKSAMTTWRQLYSQNEGEVTLKVMMRRKLPD